MLDIDFTTSVATVPFAITGVPADATFPSATTALLAKGMAMELEKIGTLPLESRALGTAQREADDVYLEQISYVLGGSTSVSIEHITSAPSDYAIVPPSTLSGVVGTIESDAPYVRIATTWDAYPGAIGYSWQAVQLFDPKGGVVWHAELSPGVVGAAPAFHMPDLTTFSPHWSSRLQLEPGVFADVSVTAATSSAGPGDWPFRRDAVFQYGGLPAGTERTTVSAPTVSVK